MPVLWQKLFDIVLLLPRENLLLGPGKINSLPRRIARKLLELCCHELVTLTWLILIRSEFRAMSFI